MDSAARYRINRPQVITETIDGEAVIIHQGTGAYYSIGASGAVIWAGVEAEVAVGEIVASVASRHEGVTPEQVEPEVQRLLEELRGEDLIAEAQGEGSGVLPAGDSPDLGAFQPPSLRKFTDMQDLILIDPVHEVDERGWPHAAEAQSGNAA